MDYDACQELQRELVYRLSRELVFYRSLYVLIERRRDVPAEGGEADLAQSYSELSTIMAGLKESQFAVAALKQKEPELFAEAARMEPVPELVSQATEVLAAALTTLKRGSRAAKQYYLRLQVELSRLAREHDVMRRDAGHTSARDLLDESG